jgi:phosphatidylglycerol:prolipoprotein diacylglycerol transferase
MDIVRFPGFNLEFNISKIAFEIGDIVVYKYAVAIVLGIVIGLILSRISKEKFGIDYDFVLEIVVGSIIFGVIGARAYYVLFNLHDYLQEPSKIFKIRDGGLAIYGGIIAIVLYCYIVCKIKKKSFLDLADYLIPYLALGQSIGRWGNFFNQEAYGKTTKSIFRMGLNTASGYIEVHPVFLYESIATLLIFIILRILQKKRKFKGQILYLYFVLYGIARMFLEALRVDSLMLGNFRISQILSGVLFVVFLGFYVFNRKKSKNV